MRIRFFFWRGRPHRPSCLPCRPGRPGRLYLKPPAIFGRRKIHRISSTQAQALAEELVAMDELLVMPHDSAVIAEIKALDPQDATGIVKTFDRRPGKTSGRSGWRQEINRSVQDRTRQSAEAPSGTLRKGLSVWQRPANPENHQEIAIKIILNWNKNPLCMSYFVMVCRFLFFA
jgi:hypothetical protein